jgi:hypothetical protein
MSVWTEAQIAERVDDVAALREGKKIATTKRWTALGTNERGAWGEVQGSAKDPYRVCIDLTETGSKCSCPSRKFPCKHAVGLMYLFAGHRNIFASAAPPQWAATWLEGRQKRRDKPADKSTEKVPDEAAQAERARAREAKVRGGMDELRRWLRDLARRGLADDSVKTYEFWDRMAARMVDAQAAGVARRLRGMAGIPFSGRQDWATRLLDEVSKLYLLAVSYQRIDTLPEATQEDMRTLIGWSYKQEAVLARPGLRDSWLVITQNLETEDRMRIRRVWLHGANSGQKALLLDFAFGKEAFDGNYIGGQSFDAELVYYPSAYPQRAAFKQRYSGSAYQPQDLTGCDYANIAAALDGYAGALAQNLWLDRFPMGLRAVIPYQINNRYFVRDEGGNVLPLALKPGMAMHPFLFTAISGNQPIPLFGEWDGYELYPRAVYVDGLVFGF